MFLAIDESIAQQSVTLGCLCVPIEDLPKFEADHIQKRLEQKVWGEIKWERISKIYLEKYKTIISSYLLKKSVTFHSWTYNKPSPKEIHDFYGGDSNKVIYKHAYILIRSVIRKCRNSGYRGPFYIVSDSTGKLGQQEYKITKNLLTTDPRFSPPLKLDFCSQGNSQVCGALQICDICTGATRYLSVHDVKKDPEAANEIVKMLEKINNGIPINLLTPTFPNLFDFKIHHCEPHFTTRN